jgi:hypothetical protein
MNKIIDRFLVIWDLERIDAKWLENRTGVKERRWYTVRSSRDMRTSELELIKELFPDYSVWLCTGFEIAESGQISPMTKETMERLKTTPEAG